MKMMMKKPAVKKPALKKFAMGGMSGELPTVSAKRQQANADEVARNDAKQQQYMKQQKMDVERAAAAKAAAKKASQQPIPADQRVAAFRQTGATRGRPATPTGSTKFAKGGAVVKKKPVKKYAEGGAIPELPTMSAAQQQTNADEVARSESKQLQYMQQQLQQQKSGAAPQQASPYMPGGVAGKMQQQMNAPAPAAGGNMQKAFTNQQQQHALMKSGVEDQRMKMFEQQANDARSMAAAAKQMQSDKAAVQAKRPTAADALRLQRSGDVVGAQQMLKASVGKPKQLTAADALRYLRQTGDKAGADAMLRSAVRLPPQTTPAPRPGGMAKGGVVKKKVVATKGKKK